MTKEQFMKELEERLQEVSYEERQSALNYYEEYFEEAGADENVVEQLESPEEIAGAIKEDLDIRLQMVRSSLDGNEKKDTDKKQEKETKKEEERKQEETEGEQTKKEENTYQDGEYVNTNFWTKYKEDKRTRDIIIIVGAFILLSIIFNGFGLFWGLPFFFGHNSIFGGVFWIIGTIISVIGIIIGLTIAGYCLSLAGVILFPVSIFYLCNSVLHGLFLMGTSFLLIGIGFFLIVATSWFWSAALPNIIQKISNLFPKRKEGSV